MPVFRYKSFDEAERALWNFNPDEKYFDNVHKLFILAGKFPNRQNHPGITKFKNIEDLPQIV